MNNKLKKAIDIGSKRGYGVLMRKIRRKASKAIEWYILMLKYHAYYRYKKIYNLKVKDKEIKIRIPSKEQFIRGAWWNTNEELLRKLIKDVKKGDVLFEVGACTGNISCIVSKSTELEKAYAFEPVPANAHLAKKQFEINSVDGQVIQKVLSNENKRVNIKVPKGMKVGYGNSSLSEGENEDKFWKDKKESINVECIKGDEVVGSKIEDMPNVILIDVEGAEGKVIDGMGETLKSKECRIVYVEVHNHLLDNFDTSSQYIEKRLKSFGFRLSKFSVRRGPNETEKPGLYKLRAHK